MTLRRRSATATLWNSLGFAALVRPIAMFPDRDWLTNHEVDFDALPKTLDYRTYVLPPTYRPPRTYRVVFVQSEGNFAEVQAFQRKFSGPRWTRSVVRLKSPMTPLSITDLKALEQADVVLLGGNDVSPFVRHLQYEGGDQPDANELTAWDVASVVRRSITRSMCTVAWGPVGACLQAKVELTSDRGRAVVKGLGLAPGRARIDGTGTVDYPDLGTSDPGDIWRVRRTDQPGIVENAGDHIRGGLVYYWGLDGRPFDPEDPDYELRVARVHGGPILDLVAMDAGGLDVFRHQPGRQPDLFEGHPERLVNVFGGLGTSPTPEPITRPFQIIACGGNLPSFLSDEFQQLVRYALLACGVAKPQILYMGNGLDSVERIHDFTAAFSGIGLVDVVAFTVEGFDHFDPSMIRGKDIIFLDGGVTEARLAIWNWFIVQPHLLKAYEIDRALFVCTSDGLLAVGEWGRSGDIKPVTVPGMGVVRWGTVGHYKSPEHPTRRQGFVQIVNDRNESGLAVGDGVGVHLEDGEPIRTVTFGRTTGSAYIVSPHPQDVERLRSGVEVDRYDGETELAPIRLGRYPGAIDMAQVNDLRELDRTAVDPSVIVTPTDRGWTGAEMPDRSTAVSRVELEWFWRQANARFARPRQVMIAGSMPPPNSDAFDLIASYLLKATMVKRPVISFIGSGQPGSEREVAFRNAFSKNGQFWFNGQHQGQRPMRRSDVIFIDDDPDAVRYVLRNARELWSAYALEHTVIAGNGQGNWPLFEWFQHGLQAAQVGAGLGLLPGGVLSTGMSDPATARASFRENVFRRSSNGTMIDPSVVVHVSGETIIRAVRPSSVGNAFTVTPNPAYDSRSERAIPTIALDVPLESFRRVSDLSALDRGRPISIPYDDTGWRGLDPPSSILEPSTMTRVLAL